MAYWKKLSVGLVLAAALVGGVITLTDRGMMPNVGINVGESPAAIHGYDPVAYFTQGEPTKGDPAFSYEHDGAVFYFATAEHRDMFAADTAQYMPAYGGFCAYGVTQKQKFDIDPNAWEIVDGRLYLQLDPGTRSIWLDNRDEHIETADAFWPEIREIPAGEL